LSRRRARRRGENGTYGHQIDHRNHQDDAGKKTSSPRNKSQPWSGQCGVCAMAGGRGLAGVTQTGTMGHGSMNREHREREETKANSMKCISRPEKARCGTRHGRPRRGSRTRPERPPFGKMKAWGGRGERGEAHRAE
jgi:hypothetical protein